MSDPVTAQLILIQGDSDNFQQIIELENRNRTIGRAQNCDIIWGSLQISRKHATLEYMVPKWYIRDTSTNGLSVNGIKLVKGELFPLKDADIISFIPTGAVRYRFRYTGPTSPLRGAAPANNVRHQQLILNSTQLSPRPSTSNAAIASCSSASSLNRNINIDRTDSRPSPTVVEVIEDGNESDDSNHSESLLSLDPPDDYFSFSGDEIPPSPINSDGASASSGPTLTKRKHKVDSSDDSDNSAARRKKKRGVMFTSSSEEEDESSKSDTNVPVPSSSFKTLRLPKKNSFISDEQISKIDDPETLRTHLRECMTKLKSTEVNLKAVECERAMEREDLRQKELDARSVNAAFKEETYKKILEVMDTELSCSVCNEVFIQATVIDCGHTFCQFCINEWARKKTECPICRKNFRNRSRHIEIENFINKIFDSFNTEIKNKRRISIQEREEQAKKALEDARAAATENLQRQAGPAGGGNNFHAFIQTTAERYVDFLAELHQINEILAPRGVNGRGGNATNNAERRRSARIQDRVIDAVVAGAAGAPAPLIPAAVPTRTRAQRGRGRAAPQLSVVVPAIPSRVPPPETARHVPNIPVVTLNDTIDDGQGGLRFPNQFMNYVRRLPIPQINLMREPRTGAGP